MKIDKDFLTNPREEKVENRETEGWNIRLKMNKEQILV